MAQRDFFESITEQQFLKEEEKEKMIVFETATIRSSFCTKNLVLSDKSTSLLLDRTCPIRNIVAQEQTEIQRYIILVSGLEKNKNKPGPLFRLFSRFGDIKCIDTHPDENYALIEYFEAQSVFKAVNYPKPFFDNKFIKANYATKIDQAVLNILAEKYQKRDNIAEMMIKGDDSTDEYSN